MDSDPIIGIRIRPIDLVVPDAEPCDATCMQGFALAQDAHDGTTGLEETGVAATSLHG